MTALTSIPVAYVADLAAEAARGQYRVALIKAGASRMYGEHTATYDELGDDEVRAPGYRAGGQPLKGARVVQRDGWAGIDFDAASWPGGGIVAEGALIYRPDRGNRAAAVLSFGGPYGSAVGEMFLLPFDCPIRF